MRLFIAVTFSKEVKQQIEVVQERIKKQAENGKFSSSQNLHLTLVFLGETPELRMPEIKTAIAEAVSAGGNPVTSFNLGFSNVGFFKRGGKELWWLGPEEEDPGGGKELKELQKALAAELCARDFPVDTRPFAAHITLGREIKNGPWPFKIKEIKIDVKRISLMLSEHVKGKLLYTELFGVDLALQDN